MEYKIVLQDSYQATYEESEKAFNFIKAFSEKAIEKVGKIIGQTTLKIVAERIDGPFREYSYHFQKDRVTVFILTTPWWYSNEGLPIKLEAILPIMAEEERQRKVFLLDHEGSLLLSENNVILYNNFGKYSPNICFLIKNPETFNWISLSREDLPKGDYSFIRGEYFVSKKGTKCFRIKDGPHIIIKDSWGGAFNSYRGGQLEKLPNQLFFRCASSNGHGMGNDYVIVPYKTYHLLNEDDI